MSKHGDSVFYVSCLTVLWARTDQPWWLFIGLLGIGTLVNYLSLRREQRKKLY